MTGSRRMKRLLEVRRHEEAVARQAYAAALRHEADAAAAVDVERAVLEEKNEALRAAQGEPIAVDAWRRLLWATFDHEQLVAARRRTLAGREEQRRRADTIWKAARQRERSIEKLEERRASDEARDARRREQKSMDEVGLRRFASEDRLEGGER